uniref:Uncharacterized protein LOC104237384 n=1 Tax=Nicotiana sylvestris TaxID=4096 RepID=A0A1U7XTM3_NICSY|nr:PREDICTED: uncharacterized protein LOC104237384 [Nicotiana sylvestris]
MAALLHHLRPSLTLLLRRPAATKQPWLLLLHLSMNHHDDQQLVDQQLSLTSLTIVKRRTPVRRPHCRGPPLTSSSAAASTSLTLLHRRLRGRVLVRLRRPASSPKINRKTYKKNFRVDLPFPFEFVVVHFRYTTVNLAHCKLKCESMNTYEELNFEVLIWLFLCFFY